MRVRVRHVCARARVTVCCHAEMALWMLPRALDCAISMIAEARGVGNVPWAAAAVFSASVGVLMAARLSAPPPVRRLLDIAVGV